MKYLLEKLDAPWKRVIAATMLSAAIVLSISAFAESTYVSSQKLQIQSAKGQHCKKWTYDKGPEGRIPRCEKWQPRN